MAFGTGPEAAAVSMRRPLARCVFRGQGALRQAHCGIAPAGAGGRAVSQRGKSNVGVLSIAGGGRAGHDAGSPVGAPTVGRSGGSSQLVLRSDDCGRCPPRGRVSRTPVDSRALRRPSRRSEKRMRLKQSQLPKKIKTKLSDLPQVLGGDDDGAIFAWYRRVSWGLLAMCRCSRPRPAPAFRAAPSLVGSAHWPWLLCPNTLWGGHAGREYR